MHSSLRPPPWSRDRTSAAYRRPPGALHPEAAEDGKRVPGHDLPGHPAAGLHVDSRSPRRLALEPCRELVGLVLVGRADEQERVAPNDGDALRFEAVRELGGLLVVRELDADLPLGEAGPARLLRLTLLSPLVLGLKLFVALRQRNRSVLPALPDRVPARELDTACSRVAEPREDHAGSFTGAFLRVGVEEDRRVVAADGDALAEQLTVAPLDLEVVEPARELARGIVVVEVDGQAPVVGHGRILPRGYPRRSVNWLLKAVIQKGLGALPSPETANYVFQRRVTRVLPIGDPGVRRKFERALSHLRAYREHGPARPLGDAVFYEFGAGWDLAVQLSYTALGVGRQTLVDIRPNVRLELVNASLASLARQRAALEDASGRSLRDLGGEVGSLEELEDRFGIAYLAPRDARATDLPAESLDFATSTNTLEHIPEQELVPILRECRRLLRPDGALSFRVDMQDHAAYSDPNVSIYDFLRFSDRAWGWITSPLSYLNRLRLSDYRRLFREAGLDVVTEDVARPTEQQLAELDRVELAPRFRAYARDDLAARHLEVVLRRSPDRAQEPAHVVG